MSRDVQGVTLDRDDLGRTNDTYITADGKSHTIKANHETTAIRAVIPGQYIVNVQVYGVKYRDAEYNHELPYPVKVRLLKVNPMSKVLVQKEVLVEKAGQQVTAFSFTVKEDGSVVDIDTEEQVPFVAIGGVRR